MFRKTVLAIAATAAIGVASLTPASAHPWHHGWGFGPVGFGLGVLGAAAIAHSYDYDSCWRYQYVMNRFGHYRRVLVNVCD